MSTSGWQIFVEVPGRAPIELEPGEAVIGRSRSCAVQIAESTVSRQHAVFVVEPGSLRLKDLGSSNGTYVNGKRVDGSIGLADGDKVVVGEAELVVRILAPLGPAEATQRLSLPPLGAPPPAAPAAPIAPASPVAIRPATPPASEAAGGFRRTPTAVPEASRIPAAAAPPVPVVPPPFPSSPPPPPKPLVASAPAASASPAVRPADGGGLAPKGGGELLPSIQEIDAVPVPPPVAVRRAPAAASGTPAGFWIRVAAYLLDIVPIFVLTGIGLVVTFAIGPDAGLLVSVVQFFLLFAYGIALAVVLPALKGNTPGKKLLKLAIVSEQTVPGQGLGWSTALLRLVGHFVCGLTFYLGYVLVAFTAQKQGLHDLIAKTRVVRRS